MKRIIKWSSLICFVALLSAHGTTWAKEAAECESEDHYPLISKKELAEVAQSKKAFIVDVNSEESFKKEHVPNAIHFGTQKKDFGKLLPKDKNAMIVAYCGSVQCTAWKKAAEEACKLGYTNIRHYKEGIKGWTSKDS